MKIIEPKVELWQQGDDSKAHVARCARVCYGRETGNDEATIKRLINDEHWSMFRHGTYYMIANDSDKTLETIIINYANTIDKFKICIPHWISKCINVGAIFTYILGMYASEETYKALINDYYLHRQDARGVLPLDTATRCIYTYSINEWRHIIDLRYYGTTGKPHPNAKLIAGMIKNNLMELGYDFKD